MALAKTLSTAPALGKDAGAFHLCGGGSHVARLTRGRLPFGDQQLERRIAFALHSVAEFQVRRAGAKFRPILKAKSRTISAGVAKGQQQTSAG